MERYRVLYKDEQTLCVICPAPECLENYTIQEIAKKDVPAGKPYKIVDVSEIPSDRTFRNAWDIDEAELTDGIGSKHDVFVSDPQHPSYVAPDEVTQ